MPPLLISGESENPLEAYTGTAGDGTNYKKAYNTSVGYLASPTGNISGVYDMSSAC